MVCKVNIKKINLSTGQIQSLSDFIAEEQRLHLFVNKVFWATIMCSPSNLKDLAVGHLLSEGVVKSIDEIENINLKDESCTVKLKQGINVEDRVRLSRLHQRVITSACGSGSPHQYVGQPPRVESNQKFKSQIIFDGVKQLNSKAAGFRQTGGLHVAAIYTAEGSMVALAEDVGRHNSVDKVIGKAALNKTDFGSCFLALSGRMSGDIAFKAAKVGLPLVASLAAALSSGVTMAKEANLTLIGFVRGQRMNVYTSTTRIMVQKTSARD